MRADLALFWRRKSRLINNKCYWIRNINWQWPTSIFAIICSWKRNFFARQCIGSEFALNNFFVAIWNRSLGAYDPCVLVRMAFFITYQKTFWIVSFKLVIEWRCWMRIQPSDSLQNGCFSCLIFSHQTSQLVDCHRARVLDRSKILNSGWNKFHGLAPQIPVVTVRDKIKLVSANKL